MHGRKRLVAPHSSFSLLMYASALIPHPLLSSHALLDPFPVCRCTSICCVSMANRRRTPRRRARRSERLGAAPGLYTVTSIPSGLQVAYTADVQSKRAKQRASVLLLRDAHPDARTWQDMMDRYPTEEQMPSRGLPSFAGRGAAPAHEYVYRSGALRSKEQRPERAVQLEPSAAVAAALTRGASSSSSVVATRAAVSLFRHLCRARPPLRQRNLQSQSDGPMEGTARSIPQGSHGLCVAAPIRSGARRRAFPIHAPE